ncbi:hypothetical protein [Thioalkalivibrio sp. HK1]|uniref:hypothetical protein n=1 Tax=Thioalkalivibrio sp. HK1 TaxID=1469245 RepID=UPI0004B59B2B|nr:hypothetical protein [Thioalkalivibrio sp. HK1]
MTNARHKERSAPEKRMHREFLFPTPIYHTQLAAADTLNPVPRESTSPILRLS